MASIAVVGDIIYGEEFVIEYEGWVGEPDGDVELEDSAGNIIELEGAVNETSSGEGTVTVQMIDLPSSGDVEAVLLGSGVKVRLT